MKEPPEIGAEAVVVMEHRDYVPPACAWHATPDEIVRHRELFALTAQRMEECQQAIWRAERVHCWFWPVTDEHQRRTAEIVACDDPDEARALGLQLLRDWQDGHCAICAGPDADFLDHSHETGLVRGRLCKCCNTGEGFAGANPEGVLERYRERNPASILGLEIRYWSPFTGWAQPTPVRDEQAELDNSPVYRVAQLLSE
jgi:hypothetical protein